VDALISLRDEIVYDPLGWGYASMNEHALRCALNNLDEAGRDYVPGSAFERTFGVSVPAKKVRHWGRKRGRFQRVKELAARPELTQEQLAALRAAAAEANPDFTEGDLDEAMGIVVVNHQEQTAAAVIALGFLQGAAESFDADDPDDADVVTKLVQGGAITVPEAQDLAMLSMTKGSRVQELGIVDQGEQVYMGHIRQAMREVQR
jgi:hypothetical protein